MKKASQSKQSLLKKQQQQEEEDQEQLNKLQKLLGKRNFNDKGNNNKTKKKTEKDEEVKDAVKSKRPKLRKDEYEFNEKIGENHHSRGQKAGNKKGIYDDQNSCSTIAEDNKFSSLEQLYIIDDDTESLTANDFEVLNIDNFYDKVGELGAHKHKNQQNLKSHKNDKQSKLAQDQEKSIMGGFLLNFEIDPATGLPKMPAYDKNINYMDEMWGMYLKNQEILASIDKIADENSELLQKVFKIEQFYDENLDRFQNERYSSGRKKHNRRCANDIERKFKCPYGKCEKFYGSEGSLNLHIKIKHNGGNKTDREKIAKSIVFAKANGVTITDNIELNLPPGAVEKAAQQVGIKIDEDQLKKLEYDLITKQEMSAKKKKEQDKLLLQSQDFGGLKPLSLPFTEKNNFSHKMNIQTPRYNNIPDYNKFKMPPPPTKHKPFNFENCNQSPQTGKEGYYLQPIMNPNLKKDKHQNLENQQPSAAFQEDLSFTTSLYVPQQKTSGFSISNKLPSQLSSISKNSRRF